MGVIMVPVRTGAQEYKPLTLRTRMAHSMETVDRNSDTPYYQQLADLLQREIEEHASCEGVYALPSENELSQRHGISRATVRHALDFLSRKGLIYRRKGKGSFGAVRRVQQDVTELVSTTEDTARRGWKLVTRVVSLSRQRPAPLVRRSLELELGQEVFELLRLRLVGGKPLSVQTSYLPVRLCPDLDKKNFASSLYNLLESSYGLRLWTARQVLRARGATRSEAELLQVAVGFPLLYVERITYAANGEAVEYLEAVWHGERYDFTVNLARPR